MDEGTVVVLSGLVTASLSSCDRFLSVPQLGYCGQYTDGRGPLTNSHQILAYFYRSNYVHTLFFIDERRLRNIGIFLCRIAAMIGTFLCIIFLIKLCRFHWLLSQ